MKTLEQLLQHISNIFCASFTTKAFWIDNGYRHLSAFISLGYLCLYRNSSLSLWKTATVFDKVVQYVIVFLIAVAVGYFIERIQRRISPGTKVSPTDVFWGALGATIGLFLINTFGASKMGLIIAIIVLALSILDMFIGKKIRNILMILVLFGLATSCETTKPISNGYEFEFSIPDFTQSKSVTNKMTLPDENGNYTSYTLSEFQNFAPEILAEYPELKSYSGVSADGKSIAIALSENGMNATIFDKGKVSEIIPLGDNKYKSIIMPVGTRRECATPELAFIADDQEPTKKEYKSSSRVEGEIKNVPLAWLCDGEYAVAISKGTTPTKAKVLAQYNATLTNVNFVYRRDFGLNLVLIAQTPDLIFLDPATDPFEKYNLNLQSQKYLTKTIGNGAYFVGGILSGTLIGSTAGCVNCAGVDDNGTVTTTSLSKGKMVTADRNPYGAYFDIDYVAHEHGHQFGAWHTMTSTSESNFTCVEPGSGSTTMSYAGISGSYNVQLHSDPQFHPLNIMQVQMYMGYKTTGLPSTFTGNKSPIATPIYDFKLPSNTPYFLKGSATDPDGDKLKYWWVNTTKGERSVAFPNPTSLTGAKSLALLPVDVNYRYFPEYDVVKTGEFNSKWFALPNRVGINEYGGIIIGYRFYVTDEKGESDYKDLKLSFSPQFRDFAVTSHNLAQTIKVGSVQEITWDVNGSDKNGIDAKNIEILLRKGDVETSILTTANDGSESVTIPNVLGTGYRIMVRANFPSGGFYSINKADLNIEKDAPPVVVIPPFDPDVDDESNAPKNLTYVWLNSNTVKLSFQPNTLFKAVGYSIYLNPDKIITSAPGVTPITYEYFDDKTLSGNAKERWNGSTALLTYTIKNVKAGDFIAVKAKDKNGYRSDRAEIILK